MQPKGWGLTRASRIVIILLVVQYLGLGQVLASRRAATQETSLTSPPPGVAALDVAVTVAVPFDASRRTSVVLDGHRSRAIPPDPAPLPRRLPRAPPAA
jgi:hypothetical protein